MRIQLEGGPADGQSIAVLDTARSLAVDSLDGGYYVYRPSGRSTDDGLPIWVADQNQRRFISSPPTAP